MEGEEKMGIQNLGFMKIEPDKLRECPWFHEEFWDKLLNTQIYWGIPFSKQGVTLDEVRKVFKEYYFGAIICEGPFKMPLLMIILKEKTEEDCKT